MSKIKINDLLIGKATKPIEKISGGAVNSEAKVYIPDAMLTDIISKNPNDYLEKLHRICRAMKDIQYGTYDANCNDLGIIAECIDGREGIFRYEIWCVVENSMCLTVREIVNYEPIPSALPNHTMWVSAKSAYRSRYLNGVSKKRKE